MLSEWGTRLKGVHVGKRIAALGVGAAAVFLAVRLIEGAAFFGAFMQGCAIAVGLMVVLSIARNHWRGDDVEEAELAGQRIKFGRTRKALGVMEQRMDRQMTTVNERLHDLEKRVFKDPDDG